MSEIASKGQTLDDIFYEESAILTFLTFMINKFESSKFQNCLSKTEILWSYFKITKNKSESQQSTSQMNESEQK